MNQRRQPLDHQAHNKGIPEEMPLKIQEDFLNETYEELGKNPQQNPERNPKRIG